ncbi:S1C family serine protease [Aliamphritea spongicola]|uniref:S1C family serine protease n=1 Tax=Aliamphritea spongicola TaxID=707589 RepID=UPI00196A3E40|nr:trypsin-like peptidase domain-containing protein [Aliamphritea spongicola]MBN3562952.1 trypsin-like peptidase domain-containing protein [Aliamphritea spongicola]
MRRLSFLIWPTISGVLAATLLLMYVPGLLPNGQVTDLFADAERPVERTITTVGPASYAEAVDIASPSVVNIYTRTVVVPPKDSAPITEPATAPDTTLQKKYEGDNLQGRDKVHTSLGSGVILTHDGYIATNNHVIANADEITVALKDGREALAQVIGRDPDTDLAVLKIDLPDLPIITISSSNNLRVGDVTLAIGNPFGVGQTVTMGIISATGRNQVGLNTYENFIQTDAAINPGNSGGALIDPYGNLIGINTAIFSRSGGSLGIGFAIPSNQAIVVMKDLIEHGRVIRGWLGIEAQEMTAQLAESFALEENRGLIIAGIYRDGPAHLGGLQPGDIMLEIEGKKIVDGRTSMRQIAQVRPGSQIRIKALRDGEMQDFTVEIIERPTPPKPDATPAQVPGQKADAAPEKAPAPEKPAE